MTRPATTAQPEPQWQEHYAIRAGCEATVSGTVHAHDLRRCRYRGISKTFVQHVLTAAGTNTIRSRGCFPPGNTPPRQPRAGTGFRQLCQTLPP
ncbi:transposase [Streptomyces sp. NPDC020951]|uniref:transposase n=1 Tax=Streptomyces sp. NPDC020951 TaxID=3365104 RepID=UPI0037AAEC82